MDKGFLAVILFAVLGFAGFFFYTTSASSSQGHYVAAPQAGQQAFVQPTLQAPAPSQAGVPTQMQEVSIKAGLAGYEPASVKVKAGQPVKITFSASPNAGCTRALLIKKAGISLISKGGSTESAQFMPEKGTYTYTCSMGMFRGQLEAD